MKKAMSVIMVLVLAIAFTACSSNTESQTETTSQNTTTSQSSTDAAADNTAEGGRTLVVYYSATGNTQRVAEYIAAATGGDLFELVPSDSYTDADLDWTDENSRVVHEYENESERDVALEQTSVENWAEYDTVFIGYPIWWGIAAWPVNTFIDANDFSSKTVIPFCTSSSSGLGASGDLLAEAAGTGNWLEGERFRSSASESDVTDWVNGLGL